MEREVMPDYAAEDFYQYLIPQDVFKGDENPQTEGNHCVAFCKKVAPYVFDISKGVMVRGGAKNFFNDEVCIIAPSTEGVFKKALKSGN